MMLLFYIFLISGGVEGVEVVEGDVTGGFSLLGAAFLFEFP